MKNWNFCVHFPANFFNMCFKREWIVDNYTKELDLWNVIQVSDIRQLMSGVWCQVSDVRRLISGVSFQMFDVRRLMSGFL